MEVSLDTLDTGDIHERADVGRQLAKIGVPEQIPRLLRAAKEDDSPGVRLYAIGAAADILSRYRVGPKAAELDAAHRAELLKIVRAIDPARNAGMFSVLATLDQPKGIRPILIGLKDPRLDVRTGAVVGMFRYAISAAAADDTSTRAEVIELLDDPKVRPDVRAHLTRICAYCGWLESRPKLERFLDREDQVAPAAEQALEWMSQLADPATVEGLWWSTRLDAGEIDPEPGAVRWLLLSGAQGVMGEVESLRAISWSLDQDSLVFDGAAAPLRRMILAPPGRGEERGLAFQAHGRTWYRAAGSDALALAEALVEGKGLSALPEGPAAALADRLIASQPDTPEGGIMAARLELLSGQSAAALQRLEELTSGKKPKNDLYFWLGEARAAAGDEAGAQDAWSRFLKKAPKRSELRELAEARVGEEG